MHKQGVRILIQLSDAAVHSSALSWLHRAQPAHVSVAPIVCAWRRV